MEKVDNKFNLTPVALTDDVAEMADYVRSREGRAAIEAGLLDIQEGQRSRAEECSRPNSGDVPRSGALRSLRYAPRRLRRDLFCGSRRHRRSYKSLFGRLRAEQFRSDLERFCEALADTPGRGKSDHGYRTPLLGVVFEYNWIFFRIDEDAAHFVHIVRSRRLKSTIRF